MARTVRLQRAVIGTRCLAIAALAGVGSGRAPGSGAIEQYAAGDNRLYRIWDDGRIDYLIVDFANGSVDGIPGWAPLHIDSTLSRDRMGNEIRAPRR